MLDGLTIIICMHASIYVRLFVENGLVCQTSESGQMLLLTSDMASKKDELVQNSRLLNPSVLKA